MSGGYRKALKNSEFFMRNGEKFVLLSRMKFDCLRRFMASGANNS